MAYGTCTQCGCTDNDCRQCIEASGEPCFWVDNEHQICSRCYIDVCALDLDPEQMEILKAQLEQIKTSQNRSFTFEIQLTPECDQKLRDFFKSIPVDTEEKIKGIWQAHGRDKN